MSNPTEELTGMVGEMFWHLHHEVLLELATEPIENRVEYIRTEKPGREIETRLRLLRPVKGKLSAAREKAHAAWMKAHAAREKADAAWEKADAEWRQAIALNQNEIDALHLEECGQYGCPWDGKTIFPKESPA